MSNLEASFNCVAEWMESYLETVVGSPAAEKIAQALHTYRDMATSSSKFWGEDWRAEIDRLEIKGDRELMEFFLLYLNAKGYRVGPGPDDRPEIRPSAN